MGCTASKIDKEEKVRICKERKRLMKQLLKCRREFADALLAYLRGLRNTGVTLRQFTEPESLELENITNELVLSLSPPPPLPPSPPPPPTFSPDLRASDINTVREVTQEEKIKTVEAGCSTSTPPPPVTVSSSSWEYWDPFQPSSAELRDSEIVAQDEEEKWEETKTEFEDGDQEVELASDVVENMPNEKQVKLELADDNSSSMSLSTKDTNDGAMVIWRNKNTLEAIIKELDDYFVKASAGRKEIAVLIDVNGGDLFQPNSGENRRKRSNSGKVFSVLSWGWSSKSMQFTKDTAAVCSPNEACKPGAHCQTLEKLYAAERRLYKESKEEETAKLEHEKKSSLLQKLEEENYDSAKLDKTRSIVESLESDMVRLQESINQIISSMLMLIVQELHPQLVALTTGLSQMWKAMFKCHQAQNRISQQLNHLNDSQNVVLNTQFHRQAAAQLETEVNYWYRSFSKLVKSQQGYVKTMHSWLQLTNFPTENDEQKLCAALVLNLSELWELALDGLPHKLLSDAIESFLLAIRSVIIQQNEEESLRKKLRRLERKLQKEEDWLAEMEKKLEGSFDSEDIRASLSPRHPLSVKHAKLEALKKQVEIEKGKYFNSAKVTRVMTLDYLKTRLPTVFQSLMVFANATVKAIEAVHNNMKTEGWDAASQNSTT